MFEDDILRGRSKVYLLLSRPSSTQIAIESDATHFGQLAHSLDAQTALQRHPRPYFVVDVSPPAANLWRCLALTLCKARLKKSPSIVLLASSRLSWRLSFRKHTSR